VRAVAGMLHVQNLLLRQAAARGMAVNYIRMGDSAISQENE